MKKLLVVGAAVLAAGSLALAGVVQAESDNAALIVRDTGCGVFNGNGVTQHVINSQLVENNATGFVVCKGDVDNDTGMAVRWDQDNNPFGPGTFYNCENGESAETWSTTVSASGKATLKLNCGTSRT